MDANSVASSTSQAEPRNIIRFQQVTSDTVKTENGITHSSIDQRTLQQQCEPVSCHDFTTLSERYRRLFNVVITSGDDNYHRPRDMDYKLARDRRAARKRDN